MFSFVETPHTKMCRRELEDDDSSWHGTAIPSISSVRAYTDPELRHLLVFLPK